MDPSSFYGRARTAGVLVSFLVSGLSLCSQAYAQPWLPDRAYTQGPGIRVGDLEIHPGIAIRGGYDTNVFRAEGDESDVTVPDGTEVQLRAPDVQGAAVLAVTPHIHLSTLTQQRRGEGEDREGAQPALPAIAFRGGLSATYLHFFLEDAPKNLEVDTDLWLGILPQRPFNIDLSLAYARTVRPFTQYAGDQNAYNMNVIQPRVRFNVGSRSQVLTAYVGYAPRVTIFESDVFNYLNNFTHGIEIGSAWRFLPNTALVYDGSLELQEYNEDDPIASASPVLFRDSKRFRTRLGINGALTSKLSLRVLAGYALVEFDDDNLGELLDDHEDVIGEAVLAWRFGAGQGSQVEAGYQRDVLTSALGGWTRLDRGFASLRAMLGRTVLLTLEAGAAYVSYGSLWGFRSAGMNTALRVADALGTNGEFDRNDVRLDGAIRAEYRLTHWLSLMADVSVQTVITDFDYAIYTGAGSPVPDPAEYLTVLAFGGIRAHY
jgi:hypothetical protein